MKKRIIGLAALAVVLGVAGCGSSSSGSSSSGSAAGNSSSATVTLKFAHTVPSGTATAECIQRFCDEVTEESGGKLVIECYPDSQLGDDDEICDQIYNGASLMDYVDPAKMEDYYADYSILVTPYFFENADEIREFAWSDLGQELSDGCAAAGMKALDNMGGYYGAREIMSVAPITVPEDMKNMKFRVPSTTMWVAMANAWGTNATSVAFSEAYTALSQGVCDAIENPVPSMLSASFQEVCDYLNLTHHMYAANGIVMNNKV
ncbi:MAG: TRAP transporter substrate-binding protein, partial [Clostridiales bacterium]|nr:TRAP transporter substrate-binding protein [Clostridiales bacterium]